MLGVTTGPPFKKRVLKVTTPSVCVDCGETVEEGVVICKDCIPF